MTSLKTFNTQWPKGNMFIGIYVEVQVAIYPCNNSEMLSELYFRFMNATKQVFEVEEKPSRLLLNISLAEPEFVNLLRSPGIDSQPGGNDFLASIDRGYFI